MKFIKAHKIIFIILILIILMIIGLIILFVKLSPDTGIDYYGNRLTDIQKYPIDEENLKKMVAELEQNEQIKSVTYNKRGRTINIHLKVTPETTKESAIQYADKTLEYFTDDIKSYYDIQTFISTD